MGCVRSVLAGSAAGFELTRDRIEVDGFGHRIRQRVPPVPDRRKVAPELLQQRDDLRDLFLGDQIYLEVEVRPLLRQLRDSILGGQDRHRHQ